MKKLLALLLALVMVLTMFACGAPADKDNGDAGKETQGTTGGEEAKGSVYYLNFKPEFNDALQQLAKDYKEATGVDVKVVTAASGTYSDTLTAEMGKENPPTIFNIGNMAGLADWDEYAIDLKDSAIAKELATDDFNLYNEDGELKAIGNCYESFGIIVNVKLLKEAGHELSEITDFASLKAVVEDIHGKAATLGFDAFTSAGLHGGSSWRFSGHLATLPLHYEGVKGSVATIKGDKLDLFKNVWDLYINNSATDPKTLSSDALDAAAEFKAGKAVFYQNGTWEYAGLIEAGLKAEDLAMIPIYCGAEDDKDAGLCSGTENCWAVNAKVSEADQKASIDFLVWLVSDEKAAKTYVEQLGAVPFKNAPASTNKFIADGNALLAAGKKSISWAFNYTPNVDAWRATVVTALTDYSAGNAEWAKVVEAFVDGWAYEYGVVNG
ncbi:MAG: ABC transporter substrate-binding protein [Oscillospiraceae bacterium]|nr:ABC transporter substrate-binding protein [Oscillospiraceae bacterium]